MVMGHITCCHSSKKNVLVFKNTYIFVFNKGKQREVKLRKLYIFSLGRERRPRMGEKGKSDFFE